jgi:hypothetical protein
MPPAGFEPTIPASERPQTYDLDRAAIGMGLLLPIAYQILNLEKLSKRNSDKASYACRSFTHLDKVLWQRTKEVFLVVSAEEEQLKGWSPTKVLRA